MSASSMFTPDQMSHSFLRAASKQKMAVLVIYAYQDMQGSPVARMASNSSEVGQLFVWMDSNNKGAVIAAAKALANEAFPDQIDPWDHFGEDERQEYLESAKKVLNAAREATGKNLPVASVTG